MTLKGYFKAFRPPLFLLGWLAPIALLKWAGGLYSLKGLLIVLGVGLSNWCWTAYNEYSDVDIDKVNKSWKPCPSGMVDMGRLLRIILILLSLSCMCLAYLSFYVDPVYFLGFPMQFTAFIYNHGRRDLIGNLAMGTTYGLAAFLPLYPNHLWFPLAFGILTISGGNIPVQYQDWVAERSGKRRLIFDQIGVKWSAVFASALTFICYNVFMYETTVTGYFPLFFFFLYAFMTLVSDISMASRVSEETKYIIIEWMNRRLGRISLLLGFIFMLVF